MRVKISKEELVEAYELMHAKPLKEYFELEGELVEESDCIYKNVDCPICPKKPQKKECTCDVSTFNGDKVKHNCEDFKPQQKIEKLWFHQRELEDFTPLMMNVIDQIVTSHNEIIKHLNGN